MAWFSRFRVAALTALLAAAPVLPSLSESKPAAPLTREAAAEQLYAGILARPRLVSAPFEPDRLNALLDGAAKFSWSAAAPDAASGAYRLSNVRLEIAGETPRTLFSAGDVLLWNFDPDALSARLSGQRLGEEIRLFDRIEMTGVKIDLSDYLNMVDDAMTDAVPGASAADLVYGASSMQAGHVVFSGLTLHPWTFEETEGEEAGVAAIRLLSAAARSFSLEAVYFGDTVTEEAISDADGEGRLRSTSKGQLLQGYDRGSLAASIQTGVAFSGLVPMPAGETGSLEDGGPQLLEMTGSSGYAAWSGLNFAPLLAYGERGELPPITARDLWSFGTYTMADTEISFGGAEVMEIGLIDVSADKFAWFLPEHIKIRHEDASFDLAAFIGMIARFEPAAAEGEEEIPIGEIAGMLERSGFGKLSGDGVLEFTWNSETGATRYQRTSLTDNLYADEIDIELKLPSYAQLVPAFGLDGLSPDRKALSDLFAETFSFTGGHYSLTDAGLLDAAAALTIEIAKVSGGEDEMLANFADSTPETVRMFASGMLMFGGGAALSDIPQATGWISGLSQFITNGGTFTVRLAPETPLTMADFTGTDPDAGMVEAPGPAQLVDLFGLSLVHTPPAEVAAGTP
ncbi:hypothetical protein [Hyphomonas sp.]|uniref:hypothetical protein n=1 Tax=Hyphomonas sp. TaxID=87 RepID=UPI00391D54D5